jgi:hypothetical protein
VGLTPVPDRWTKRATGGPAPADIDRTEVGRALALWIDPGEHHEVRALPAGRSRLVSGDHLDAAVIKVAEIAGGAGTYLTLNPVDPAIGDRAARQGDARRRAKLLIDFDTIRPDKGRSSTDGEKESARIVLESVRDYLDGLGWPGPVVIDSGNGWHLLYKLDLPSDKLVRAIIKAALAALADRFDVPDAVAIDRAVHDPSRISKLPGTWVRKGEPSEDRPHRMARLVSIPTAWEPVPIEKLKAVAGIADSDAPDTEPPPPTAKSDPGIKKVGGDDDYARSALEREVGRVATAREDRNTRLNTAAFNLGTLVGAQRLPEAEVREKLAAAARAAGLGADGDPEEIDRAITNGLAAGKAKPSDRGSDGARGKAKKPPTATVGPDGRRSYNFALIIRGCDVVPKQVKWLWHNRVPIGFLTLIAGRTGVGKSFTTLDLCARLTRGGEPPDSPGECLDAANVLIISEDPQEYMLAPRLIELGADMRRTAFMTLEAMAAYELSDTNMLDDAYRDAGAPRIIVIDPPTNFLGAKDEHKNAEVRGVLMRVAVLAMRHDLAVVMITHCNKGIKKDMAALDRVIGSIAWASTSRIAHILAPDPDDPGRSLFVCLKNNLGPLPKGIAYRIRTTDALATVEWLGPVDITGDQALNGPGKPRRVVAAEWLIDRFRERLEWPSDDLFHAAREANVSRDAVFEAKAALELPKARQITAENGNRFFVWWVPPDWPPLRRAPK